MKTKQLKFNKSKEDFIKQVENQIKEFGLGFHPDTLAEEYTPELSKKECKIYTDNIDLIFSILTEKEFYDKICDCFKELKS